MTAHRVRQQYPVVCDVFVIGPREAAVPVSYYLSYSRHRNRSRSPKDTERRLETGLWRGVRHRHCESRRKQLPPSAYRYRASCRLYTNRANTLIMPSVAATVSGFPPDLWKVPSTRLSANDSASVSRCGGRKAVPPHVADPGADPRRHAAGEVRAMVPRTERRRQGTRS